MPGTALRQAQGERGRGCPNYRKAPDLKGRAAAAAPLGYPDLVAESIADWLGGQIIDLRGRKKVLRAAGILSRTGDAAFRDWFARSMRAALSPSAAYAMLSARARLDVRSSLDAVTAPTLVVHRADDRLNPVDHGRYLARRLAHAQYVELAGEDHLWWVPRPEEIAGIVTGFLADLGEEPA